MVKNNRLIYVLITVVVLAGLIIVFIPSVRENIAGEAIYRGSRMQKATSNLPHGSTCYRDSECRSGSCPSAPPGVFSRSGRICRGPFLTHGSSCGATDVCSSGLACRNGLCLRAERSISDSETYCLHDSECTSNFCNRGVCITPSTCGDNIREGSEQCDYGEANGISCSPHEPGAVRGASCCDSNCQLSFVPLTRSSSCTDTRQCETGSICRNGLCLAEAGSVANFNLCYQESECGSRSCLLEGVSGTCVPRRTDIARSFSCRVGVDTCEVGLQCHNGLCLAPVRSIPAYSLPCYDNSECSSNSCLNPGFDGVCIVVPVGSSCHQDSDCINSVCAYRICTMPNIVGEGYSCNLGGAERCASGLLCAINSVRSQAIEYPNAKYCITPGSKNSGDVCELHQECSSNSCSVSVRVLQDRSIQTCA